MEYHFMIQKHPVNVNIIHHAHGANQNKMFVFGNGAIFLRIKFATPSSNIIGAVEMESKQRNQNWNCYQVDK